MALAIMMMIALLVPGMVASAAETYTVTILDSVETNHASSYYPIGEGIYEPGDTVYIDAQEVLRAGYWFDGWGVNFGLDYYDINDGTASSTFFTMPNNDVSIKAYWMDEGGSYEQFYK